MLLNEKKAKIRELTNNGPVPEARIPNSPEPEDIEPVKPKRGAKTKTIKAKPFKPPPVRKNKRKQAPTPEPEVKEDTPMPDESVTEDENDSVQADEERDVDVERTFGLRDDEEDVTEDEEL
jgi:hypothetical protein